MVAQRALLSLENIQALLFHPSKYPQVMWSTFIFTQMIDIQKKDSSLNTIHTVSTFKTSFSAMIICLTLTWNNSYFFFRLVHGTHVLYLWIFCASIMQMQKWILLFPIFWLKCFCFLLKVVIFSSKVDGTLFINDHLFTLLSKHFSIAHFLKFLICFLIYWCYKKNLTYHNMF